MSENYKKGIIFALLTAVISGFSIFYNKLIVTKDIDPQIFNIIKNGGVVLLLTLFFFSANKLEKFKKLTKLQWGRLLALGIIGGSIPFILYFDGLRSVSAINASLIHKTMFIWVALLAYPLLKERLNRWQIIGYILVAGSNLLIGSFTGFSQNTGELMIFVATLFWSVENILVKLIVKDIDSNIAVWGRMFLGVIVILGYVVWQNKLSLFLSLTPNQVLPITGSILLLTGYVVTWYKALQLAPATAVTSILIFSTPITNVLNAIFITHTLPAAQIINLVGIIIGIFLITVLVSKSEKPSQKLAEQTL